MLRDPTSRGLYVRVWPPHTSDISFAMSAKPDLELSLEHKVADHIINLSMSA